MRAINGTNVTRLDFRQRRRLWHDGRRIVEPWGYPEAIVEPYPTGDPWLDELLSYAWNAGRKAGLPGGDPLPAAHEMHRRIDEVRLRNGLMPLLAAACDGAEAE